MKTAQNFDIPAFELTSKFTHAEMDTAFHFVSSEQDWRRPIDAVVPNEQVDLVVAAIAWFTGGQCHILSVDSSTSRVISEGAFATQVC